MGFLCSTYNLTAIATTATYCSLKLTDAAVLCEFSVGRCFRNGGEWGSSSGPGSRVEYHRGDHGGSYAGGWVRGKNLTRNFAISLNEFIRETFVECLTECPTECIVWIKWVNSIYRTLSFSIS